MPDPTFEFDYLIDCGVVEVVFNNTTNNMTSYSFEWGVGEDGSQATSNSQDYGISFITDSENPTESFVISMSATDSDSCTATSTQVIDIPQPPNLCDSVDFELNLLDSLPCDLILGIDSIDFEYDTTQYELVTNYIWDAGGLSIVGTNEVTVPNSYALGFDELTLTISIDLLNLTNPEESISCVCSEIYSLDDIVDNYEYFSCECQPGGAPVADFNIVNEDDCGNLGIGFENTSTGGFGSNYSWEFGVNGEYGVSSESSPTMNLIINGGYTETIPVTLTITDASGCENSITQDVTVLETPFAGESPCFNIQNICTGNPNQVTTEITLCSGFNNGIQEVIINWGDTLDDGSFVITTHSAPQFPPGGQFVIESPPYDDFGYYNITIDLIGENGCITTIADDMFIGNNPTIGVGNPGNTDGVCTPYDLTFPIFNFESNDPSTVYWVDFGDGSGQELFS